MIHRIKLIFVVAITAVLAACGGGGDDTPFFAGKYSLKVNLISNNCNADVPGTLVGTVTIEQNNRDVALNLGSLAFAGQVDGDDGGFSAKNITVINGKAVESLMAARTETTGSTYTIRYSVTANPCSAIYTGTATKI